jgi:hypothetical protein
MFSRTHSRLICCVKRISLLLGWMSETAMAVDPFYIAKTGVNALSLAMANSPNKKPASGGCFVSDGRPVYLVAKS